MNKIGKFAAVLAISASSAVIASSGSPALADPHPIIDIIDDVVPNANVLPNLIPNPNIAPSVLCLPGARNDNSIKGDHNQVTTSQTNNCTQSAQQTTPTPPPPSDGGLTGYEIVAFPFTVGPGAGGAGVATFTVECPSDKVPVLHGYDFPQNPAGPSTLVELAEAYPSDAAGAPSVTPNSVTFRVDNVTREDQNGTLYVACATAP
ncbi:MULTISPECIES: hypothetical protein [unclassified Nonomuraea]|uniref:hypothetical protein n=1 Tax=unclassified Nonomuraea TaxID=2593643 RepID=UPI0035C12C35